MLGRVAVQVLRLTHMYLTPLCLLCRDIPKDMGKIPNGPLLRMYKGLRALPQVMDVCITPLTVGDWCHAAPLWGNPLLPVALMDPDFAPARAIQGLATLGDLLHKTDAVRHAGVLMYQTTGALWAGGLITRDWMQKILMVLPEEWVRAAVVVHRRLAQGSGRRPLLDEALAVILPRLGWRNDSEDGALRVVSLIHLCVKNATALQLADSRLGRVRAHKVFINEACDREVEHAVASEDLLHLGLMFKQCWALNWDNKFKDIFWRLAVDGVADGHRWAGLTNTACVCGAADPRRRHFFWSCPVAQVVVEEINRCLPGEGVVNRQQLWLMVGPIGVPQDIWVVVCLAALNSMDIGRRKLLSHKLPNAAPDDPEYESRPAARRTGARGRAHVYIRSNQERVTCASQDAVKHFWEYISDFAALGELPNGANRLSPFLRGIEGGLVHHRP